MSTPRVFLIHGFEGNPAGGWRPWLMGQLGREGIYACALPMPTPAAPKKDEWVAEITRAIGTPDDGVILVGHSLGGPAIMQYLATLAPGQRIGGAVLAASPARNIGTDYAILDGFYEPAFNYDIAKAACRRFAVIHGDTDPLVPFAHGEELAQKLDCELITIKDGGHLNGQSGCYELPEAFNAIQSFLRE